MGRQRIHKPQFSFLERQRVIDCIEIILVAITKHSPGFSFTNLFGKSLWQYWKNICAQPKRKLTSHFLGSFREKLADQSWPTKIVDLEGLDRSVAIYRGQQQNIADIRNIQVNPGTLNLVIRVSRLTPGALSYVDGLQSVRQEVHALRATGKYSDCFLLADRSADTLIAALDKSNAERAWITDISLHILFVAAYGFFQSEDHLRQIYVLERIKRLAEEYGKTSYSHFIEETIKHQITSNEARMTITAEQPFLRFDKSTKYATDAYVAYTAGNDGFKSNFPHEPGLAANGALEFASKGASMNTKLVEFGDKTIAQVVEEDVAKAVETGGVEGAARLLFGAAEAYLRDSGSGANRELANKALSEGFVLLKKAGPTVGPTATAKGILILGQVEMLDQGRAGCAAALAGQSATIFDRHGAIGRAEHARMLEQHWWRIAGDKKGASG